MVYDLNLYWNQGVNIDLEWCKSSFKYSIFIQSCDVELNSMNFEQYIYIFFDNDVYNILLSCEEKYFVFAVVFSLSDLWKYQSSTDTGVLLDSISRLTLREFCTYRNHMIDSEYICMVKCKGSAHTSILYIATRWWIFVEISCIFLMQNIDSYSSLPFNFAYTFLYLFHTL